jgi:ribosomal protein S18 acetylase RimI-like enzyme
VAASALIRAALAELRTRGFQLAQALLDESAPHQGALDLTRGGLPRVTELLYQERSTTPPIAVEPRVPALAWRGYEPASEPEFREILEASYVGSRDMPELEGMRSLDDILSSHRAGGRFEPSRWCIARLSNEPAAAAVVLMSQLPDRDAWEVAYLGLTPPARGRGLGRAALAHAVALAQPHTPRLELAVDSRNIPALRLYRSVGFTVFDRRSVHLAMLSPARAGSPAAPRDG